MFGLGFIQERPLDLNRGEGGLYILPPFDNNYRLLFPALLLLYDDVSGWQCYLIVPWGN